ncbi:unnamed protein product [Rotaria sp. Silwood2]|nr:unnamed protein product [Rotaria sp. Silwood2]
MGDKQSKGFYEHIYPATYGMLSHPDKCWVHLPESMVRKAAAHTSVDGSYVCGLNAMRCCLLMKGYKSLPTTDNYPYQWFFVESNENNRTGPTPSRYAKWMQNWCSGWSYQIRYDSWDETTNFIQKNLREGNPVIALGSEAFKAHYFPIVGWGEKHVFVLSASGELYWIYFLTNRVERNLGMDLNGDGYIGGQGFMSRLERATHIDFNRDNIIGRVPDAYYGYPSFYGNSPPMGYGGYPSMNFGYGTPFGYY